MTKQEIVRQTLKQLKAKGLLNETAVKKHLKGKKSLKEDSDAFFAKVDAKLTSKILNKITNFVTPIFKGEIINYIGLELTTVTTNKATWNGDIEGDETKIDILSKKVLENFLAKNFIECSVDFLGTPGAAETSMVQFEISLVLNPRV